MIRRFDAGTGPLGPRCRRSHSGAAAWALAVRALACAAATVAAPSLTWAVPNKPPEPAATATRRFGVGADLIQLGEASARLRVHYALTPRAFVGAIAGAGAPPSVDLDELQRFEAGVQGGWVALGSAAKGVGLVGQALGRWASGSAQPMVDGIADGPAVTADSSAFLFHGGVFGRWTSPHSGLYIELDLLYGYAYASGTAQHGSTTSRSAGGHVDGRGSLYLGVSF